MPGVPEQGAWLKAVVLGFSAYEGVPSNFRVIGAFRYRVVEIWLKLLRRRSQKYNLTWERMIKLAADWLSVTGHTFLYFDIQANFTAIPWRSTPSLFLRCRAPSLPWTTLPVAGTHLFWTYRLVACALELAFTTEANPVAKCLRRQTQYLGGHRHCLPRP